MKKILSIVLSVCILIVLASTAFAADGVFTGEGRGHGETPIKVEVTVEGGAITAVKIVEHAETAGIGDPALERIPEAIVSAQSLAVDTIASATESSNGILAAVEAACEAAGLDVAALSSKTEGEAPVEKAHTEQSTDVLVIGGGISGFAAALSAKENGADVLIIDKSAAVGGTTNLAGGILVSVNSELFKDNRLESDSLESVLNYWHERQAESGVDSGYPDWTRLEGILADTGKTVDWLVANDIRFDAAPYAASTAYPMALADGAGAGLIQMMLASAEAKGITVLTETKATELITDAEGSVVGAKAETADAEITFNAKAVILCTGGISHNEELVEKYSPKLHRAGLIPTSAASHTGDGFLMALEVGAGTFDVFATPLFGTMVDPKLGALTDTSAISILSQLGVNANGNRFANEAAAAGWDVYDRTASDMIQDGNAPFWYIFDASDEAAVAQLEAGVADGIVAKGETVAELALNMHVYTANLEKAFEAYNAAAAAGEDAEFGKPAMFLKAIEKAPFYAVKVYPTTFGSAGGVTTTEDGRVTRQDGTVIPGLYAAGEMSNRYFYNENYILAASLGLYSTMGRRAGAAAAADIAK
ncbi:MAG: FAD-dependent oxidoreductase [Clostridia bacterium]|nr:FAD-dependent oxidoreductase [Clostridia bacterium]